jgi:hypothetical protein
VTLSDAESQALHRILDVLVFSVDPSGGLDFGGAVRNGREDIRWFLLGCLWMEREGEGITASEMREVTQIVHSRASEIRRAVEVETPTE